MVKVIYEPVICESIASHYKETGKLTADRFANEYNLPLLNIPTAKPQMRDANDWYARFECVKSTFSSRVGQISNAALDRSMIAYNENTENELKEQNRRDTETLAIKRSDDTIRITEICTVNFPSLWTKTATAGISGICIISSISSMPTGTRSVPPASSLQIV